MSTNCSSLNKNPIREERSVQSKFYYKLMKLWCERFTHFFKKPTTKNTGVITNYVCEVEVDQNPLCDESWYEHNILNTNENNSNLSMLHKYLIVLNWFQMFFSSSNFLFRFFPCGFWNESKYVYTNPIVYDTKIGLRFLSRLWNKQHFYFKVPYYEPPASMWIFFSILIWAKLAFTDRKRKLF